MFLVAFNLFQANNDIDDPVTGVIVDGGKCFNCDRCEGYEKHIWRYAILFHNNFSFETYYYCII